MGWPGRWCRGAFGLFAGPCRASRAGAPPAWCIVAGSERARRAPGWARRAGSGGAGQFTAERVKTRMAAVVVRMAQPARTSRLRAASVVVLVIPQMLCSPAPVWSSTP
jgi:hypothetical protein